MRTKDEALHRRRRAEIVSAAARCFARKGVHQTTMPEICDAAGISAGALYRYFPSKDSIITALAEDERDHTRDLVDHLAGARDLLSGLDQVVPDLVRVFTDPHYARLALEISAEASRNTSVAEVFERNEAEVRDALEVALRRGQASGVIDRDLDVDATVFLLMSLFDGITGRSAFSSEVSTARLDRALRRTLRGILAPAHGDPDHTP